MAIIDDLKVVGSHREPDPKVFRRRLLLEIAECEPGSAVKPWVDFKTLPCARDFSADYVFNHLEILESEGRVELRKLYGGTGIEDCTVKLTGTGRKSLEVDEDRWQLTHQPTVNATTLNIHHSQVGNVSQLSGAHHVEIRQTPAAQENTVPQAAISSAPKGKPPSLETEAPKATPEPLQAQHPTSFVCHSTQDRAFVEKFATDLRANGVDAWYSGWEIKPGDSITAKIDTGLAGCEYFVIVLSKNSVGRPWVQTELDAATVRKLAGKVRKIIPVKIEDCGELPPTLGSLLWEDFSNQPYESAMKRVLHSIFDIDVRPPLGTPPTSVRADVLPMGLAPKDRLIFEALCRNTIATGFALIDDITPVVEALRERGISEQQIVEAQELLEELGYVRLHRVAGPSHPYCQTITVAGFDTFANANIPGFQNLIATVRQRVLQGGQLENAELAKELDQPLRIVDHILEVMEDRGWITLTREIGGGYESLRVDLVSPSLKRTYPE